MRILNILASKGAPNVSLKKLHLKISGASFAQPLQKGLSVKTQNHTT